MLRNARTRSWRKVSMDGSLDGDRAPEGLKACLAEAREAAKGGSDPPQLAAAELAVEIQRLADDADGVLDAQHVLDDHLLVLQCLVVFEEAADFAERVTGDLPLVGVFGERRVAHADRDDLVVDAF